MDVPVYFLSSSQELQTDVRQEFVGARLQAKAVHEAVHAQREAAHQDINRVIEAIELVRCLHSIDTLLMIDNGTRHPPAHRVREQLCHICNLLNRMQVGLMPRYAHAT